MKKEKKGRSKVVVIVAWVLLLVFIISFVSIIGLKFLVNDEKRNQSLSEGNKTLEREDEDDLSVLWKFIENFNNSSLRKSYLEQGVDMEASVLDDGITVRYQINNRNKNYHFIYHNKELEIKINQSELEEFYGVFRIMVHAVQGLLGNDKPILDTYVKDFFYQDKEITGLKKEKSDASVRYLIDTTVELEGDSSYENEGDNLENHKDVPIVSG